MDDRLGGQAWKMHFEWEQKEIIVLIHSMKASSGTFLVLLSTFRVRGHSKLTKSIHQSTYYYNYLRALLNTINRNTL